MSRNQALADLINLCTGAGADHARKTADNLVEKYGRLPRLHAFHPNPAHALFALEIERMMGSIQEAADVALTAPKRYPSLYLIMTSGANPNDVTEWYNRAETDLLEVSNTGSADRKQIKDAADRFGRLRQVMKRKLDGFQLYTGDRWASYNQAAANVVGALLMAGVLWWMRGSQVRASTDLGEMIILSLLGGILSPIAKDLVTALKRVTNG